MTLEGLLRQQDMFNVFLAFFSLVWIGYLLLKTEVNREGPRLLLILFFTLSLGSALEERAFHLRFDRQFGQNNIAWLVLWELKTISLYVTLRAFYLFIDHPFPKRIYYLTLLAMGLYFVLWPPIRHNPSLSIHLLPRDGFEYAFFLVFYLYLIIVVAIATPETLKRIREDQSWNARIRLMALFGEGVAISLAFLLRIVYVTVHFGETPSSANMFLYQLSNLFLGITGFLMLFNFWPNKGLTKMSRYLHKLKRLLEMRDLHAVHAQLTTYFPGSIGWTGKGLRARITDLDLYEYRLVLTIMDKKRMLAGYLALPEEEVQHLARFGEIDHWICQAQARANASQLLKTLQVVDDTKPYHELVVGYQALGRQLKSATKAL
jgi:hypothetical protein